MPLLRSLYEEVGTFKSELVGEYGGHREYGGTQTKTKTTFDGIVFLSPCQHDTMSQYMTTDSSETRQGCFLT